MFDRVSIPGVSALILAFSLAACAAPQPVRWDGDGSEVQFKIDKRACEVITNNEVGTRSFEQPTGRTIGAERRLAARRFARRVYGECMDERGWRPADGAAVPDPRGIAYP